jgi:hypothetical protein
MAVGFFGKQLLKNLIKGGKQKTTGTEVVQPFKFKPAKSKLEKSVKNLQIATAKESGKIKKFIQKMESDIEPFRRKLRQTTQKVAGEKVTKSGVSKGKDRIKKMGGGLMGKRMGYSQGSSKGKVPTTSKEKTFGMLSVKAKKDNNPNITFTDKIVGAKKT